MKKSLTSKLAVCVVVLLLLVGTMVQPNQACRVLIMGKEEGRANDKPSVPVLQVLQKGTVPTPGNPGSHTPGADTTDTRAFAGRAMAAPGGYSDRVPKSHVAAGRK